MRVHSSGWVQMFWQWTSASIATPSPPESAVVTTFDTKEGIVRKIGQAVFAPNAHVVGVDQRSHRVHFPLRGIDGEPILRVAVPRPFNG